MPTSTVAPLRFMSEAPCSAAPLTPTVTKTQSALRPPVSALTRSATSSLLALIVSVAPNSRAAASLAGSMSTAMIGEAPASRAPWMELRPTPPQPMTTTLDPALTPAVLTTAPIPVSTPQAISAALSSGTSFGMATAWDWSTTIRSANAPVRRPWTSGLPAPSCSGVERSSGNTSSQKTGAPSAQAGQKPQLRISVATTWSPAFSHVTPAPTASTIPAASWP